MVKKVFAVSVGLMLVFGSAVADDRLIETRYCGEPVRNKNGSIKRSEKVRSEFEKLYPLPIGYHRNEWQIDHVIPLERGGVDAVYNMQWLPKTIKTCAEDDCKDRWERAGIYPKKTDTECKQPN